MYLIQLQSSRSSEYDGSKKRKKTSSVQICQAVVLLHHRIHSSDQASQDIDFQLKNYLYQLDSGDSGDHQGWRGHHYGEHCRKNLHLHTVPCLHNAGSWLGCIWSRSNLQLPLLCSASFSGLTSFYIICFPMISL